MLIDKRLIPIFEKIDFAHRYIGLCKKFVDFENRLLETDFSFVEQIYAQRGIPFKFLKKDKLFKVEDSLGQFNIQFKTVLSDGFLQLFFSVNEEGKKLKVGMGMWEVITRSLTGEIVRKPIFTSNEDLESILNEAIDLYRDFKRELSLLS